MCFEEKMGTFESNKSIFMIRTVVSTGDFKVYAALLNAAFATVAEEFGLTRENSPTHNAFISQDQLMTQLTETDREFFYYEEQGRPVGFVAIEKSPRDPRIFYIEKLAVHPEFRNRKIGRLLMDHATRRISARKGQEISIGLIDSNEVLKKWYQGQGFVETEVKEFPHLPFKVCLMSKPVE